jgi:hypothetical protein
MRRARERHDGALDLTGVADVDRADLDPDRGRHRLNCTELAKPRRNGRIPKHQRARHGRRDLFEQRQPLSRQAEFERQEAGDVAARPREVVDKAGAHRIWDDREYDRHGTGRLQQGTHSHAAIGDNDIRCERDQFRCKLECLGWVPRRPAGIDLDVATNDPAELLQSLRQRRNARLTLRIVGGDRHEHAEAPHAFALLRARRRRRPGRRRAAERQDEGAPV